MRVRICAVQAGAVTSTYITHAATANSWRQDVQVMHCDTALLRDTINVIFSEELSTEYFRKVYFKFAILLHIRIASNLSLF